MYVSVETAEMINKAISMAKDARFEYVTPELVLYVLCGNEGFARAFENCGGRIEELDGACGGRCRNRAGAVPGDA